MNKMMTIFASSDGWTPSRPTLNQRLRAVDRAREQHGERAPAARAETGPDDDRLAVVAVVDAHHDRHQRQPERRPTAACLNRNEVRAAVAAPWP